ncbi:MAG: hypothetical protein QOF61_77 [Acidobacteriota bacterium]|jgi:hypothetical protein|nr:hypothetical protein [Acidobacteriota bacterium]
MAQDGSLKLSLIDVYGKRLQESVDIFMRNMTIASDQLNPRGIDASKLIIIKKLSAPTNNVYQIIIDPPSYHPTNRFVSIKSSGTEEEYVFGIDIAKVVRVDFPTFASNPKELRDLLGNSSLVVGGSAVATGEALYDGLDDIRKAGLMNIACKTLATALPNGKRVLQLINKVVELRGDRFFANVERELREETLLGSHTGLFHEAPGILHSPPPPFSDFDHAGSFKTDDTYGNLQLTFFRKGDDIVADIDIDDAGGFRHIFQVAKNHFTGLPTHPYNINQILIKHQHLNPRYTLLVR